MYASSSFVGYSLWLVPSDDQLRTFQEVISDVGKEFQSPVFKPHCTLYAGFEMDEVELVQRIGRMIEEQRRFRLRVREVVAGELYFQSIYGLIYPTETLCRLRAKTVAEFCQDPDSTYMPHISLHYGDVSSEKRMEILDFIEKHRRSDALYNEFTIDKAELWKTFGTTDEWKLCAEFLLIA